MNEHKNIITIEDEIKEFSDKPVKSSALFKALEEKGVPAASASDKGKVLMVNSSGNAEWVNAWGYEDLTLTVNSSGIITKITYRKRGSNATVDASTAAAIKEVLDDNSTFVGAKFNFTSGSYSYVWNVVNGIIIAATGSSTYYIEVLGNKDYTGNRYIEKLKIVKSTLKITKDASFTIAADS